MMSLIAVFLSALLFGIGLGISGMTLPAKVLGFLDVMGGWDPSLAFVMVGAIGIHCLFYHLIRKQKKPILADDFQVPPPRPIDRNLVVGSLIFGIGWGLGGFCPGPALVGVVSGASSVIFFVVSMIAGIYLYNMVSTLGRNAKEKN